MNTCISQRTLKNVIRATGIGAHSGAHVHLTLRPAPADHGIVFVRTDLAPPVRLPVRVGSVAATSLTTTLVQGEARLSTVEHLLAAFAGLGIDNAVVEVDAPELPIMDGSAGPFVFLIQSAGIATQSAARRYIRVLETVRVEDGDAWAELRPHDGFRVDYTLRYDHPEAQRSKSAGFELSPTAFVREISRARAFGAGAGCGPRDPQVPGGNTVRMEDRRANGLEGLRLGDEFVRHKVLDVIGDLYLLGFGLIGAFAGSGSGHGINHRLVQRLLADRRAWEIVTFADHVQLAAAFGRRPAPLIAETA